MMRPKIYCDQDGVLADWAKYAEQHFDFKFNGYVKLTEAQWDGFKAVYPNMWYELDHMPHALELWDIIQPYCPDILTALPHEGRWEGCAEQKLRWAQDRLPGFGRCASQTLIACERHEKCQYATTNGVSNILIDDMERNVEEWNVAGGIGIVYRADPVALKHVRQTLTTYYGDENVEAN
jgi:hypothetical protein